MKDAVKEQKQLMYQFQMKSAARVWKHLLFRMVPIWGEKGFKMAM